MVMLSASLAERVLDASLPWEHSIQFHIADFLKRYTLHDSYWIGLLADCAFEDSAVAIIRFDPVWNSSVSAPTSRVADWPLLFLKFNCVSNIQMSGFRGAGQGQRGISDATFERITDEEVVTTIHDHYGGEVTLRHFPIIDALALSPGEEVLKLSV
jgi:hypothetical protein